MITPRVLIVEDEVTVAVLLKTKLESMGYEVAGHARSGEEALELAGQLGPDLILMDIGLNGRLDGIDVAQTIREDLGTAVVYLTSYVDEDTVKRAKVTEPFGYLIKPFSTESLRTTLEMALYKAAMEKRLKESEQRLELALTGANLGLWDWNVPTDDTVLNERAAKMLGYDRNELEGLFRDWGVLIHPDDREQTLRELNRHLDGETPFFCTEQRFKAKNGEWIWIMASGKVVARDPAGKPLRVTGTLMDINDRRLAEEELHRHKEQLESIIEERTADLVSVNRELRNQVLERSRAEKEARESENRFRAIFESASDCIFIMDRSLRYILVNPAMEKLLDTRESEIIGHSEKDLFDAATWEHISDVCQRVLSGETIEGEHTRLIGGLPTTFLETRLPLHNQEGEIIGLCGFWRNITDRRRTVSGGPSPDVEYRSPAMGQTLERALVAAQINSIVLLLGESGSGKDFLAKYIHDHSGRSSGPFFSINCAALTPELAESELFGHERGAFTGANSRKRGLLELAEGGTLLLNEIGELTPQLQAKLLTFLDTRSFTRVGGEKNITVDARLIAATNRDLARDVEDGRFRRDLFFRLNVFTLHVPPLRERIADIPALVEQLCGRLAEELQLPGPPPIDRHTLTKLCRYHWPGNVRELRNVLERALIVSRGAGLQLDGIDSGLADDSEDAENSLSVTVEFPLSGSLNELSRDFKRGVVKEALKLADGRKVEAAKLLGISRDALKGQLRTLGMSGEF